MSGITKNGIRYPDGATKAKQLGPELKRMAEDTDSLLTKTFDATSPAFQQKAEEAARAAVEAELSDSDLARRSEIGTARSVNAEFPLYSEVQLTRDFRMIGGRLREGGDVGTLPGYLESALAWGNGEVLLTRDFRQAEPGSGPDGLTPQHLIDQWGTRMSSTPSFNSLVGIGDSMTTAYGGGLSQTLLTATELGVVGYDRGGSGDTPYEIGFRLGAVPIRITVDGGVIPAIGSVSATVETPENSAGWWHERSWKCQLRAIDGSTHSVILHKALSSKQGGPIGVADVSLVASTQPVTIAPNTRVKHEQSFQDTARFAPAIIWIGRNDPDEKRIVSTLEALLSEHRDPAKRAMIVPLFTRDTSPACSPSYISDMAINAAVAKRFPSEFFDSRTALIHGGLQVSGLTPTEADLAAIAEDRIPPSFRPPGDPTHLNDAGRRALARIHATEIAARSW